MLIIGIGTGIYGGYGPLVSELFPTEIRSTAMGSGFNIARGTQFFTPILIALIAIQYWFRKWNIPRIYFCFKCCHIHMDFP